MRKLNPFPGFDRSAQMRIDATSLRLSSSPSPLAATGGEEGERGPSRETCLGRGRRSVALLRRSTLRHNVTPRGSNSVTFGSNFTVHANKARTINLCFARGVAEDTTDREIRDPDVGANVNDDPGGRNQQFSNRLIGALWGSSRDTQNGSHGES